MSKKVDFVCLGSVTNSRYLGQQIVHDRTRRVIRVSQSDLITGLLEEWGMLDCKTSLVPLPHNLNSLPPCSPNACPDIPDADITLSYQCLVGSITYLAICTCLDLAYCTMALGQHNASLTHAHLVVAKGVLRYLAGTVHLGLIFSTKNHHVPQSIQLHTSACGLSDADWASDESDRKSISSYCFFFHTSLVSWSARKQRTVSTSSTESEYYALANTMKEAIWIKLFLTIAKLHTSQLLPLEPSLRQSKRPPHCQLQFCFFTYETYRCMLPLHMRTHYKWFFSSTLDTDL